VLLYLRWPFTQQPEFLLIEDNHFTADSTNNASILQLAHNPYRCLRSGSHHVSDSLSGKGEGRAKLCRKHEQYTGQTLLNSLPGKVSKTPLSIPEPSR